MEVAFHSMLCSKLGTFSLCWLSSLSVINPLVQTQRILKLIPYSHRTVTRGRPGGLPERDWRMLHCWLWNITCFIREHLGRTFVCHMVSQRLCTPNLCSPYTLLSRGASSTPTDGWWGHEGWAHRGLWCVPVGWGKLSCSKFLFCLPTLFSSLNWLIISSSLPHSTQGPHVPRVFSSRYKVTL